MCCATRKAENDIAASESAAASTITSWWSFFAEGVDETQSKDGIVASRRILRVTLPRGFEQPGWVGTHAYTELGCRTMISVEMVVAKRIPVGGVPDAKMTADSSSRWLEAACWSRRRDQQASSTDVVAGQGDQNGRRSSFMEGNAR